MCTGCMYIGLPAVVVVLHKGGRGIQDCAPLEGGGALVGVEIAGGGGG